MLDLQIPESVQRDLAAIRARGGRAWLVGGVVRDALLGIESPDFDVATDLRPADLAALFGGVDLRLGAVHREIDTGSAPRELTITSLRRDGEYHDRRRPAAVEFVDAPEVDALRRDFTVNAIYYDPGTRQLIDPCGGRGDLEDRVLRVIGDPDRRLFEDPLRLLRAVRFAARLGLGVEPATAAALRRQAAGLGELAVERAFDELTRAFTGPGRGAALRLLVEFGLAPHVLPEVCAMPGVEQPPEYHPEGDVFVHVCLVLDHVRPGDPVQAWAAVLHDVGKPATFERAADRIRFTGHDTLSATMADAVLRRFRASRELRETVVEVCRDHIRFASILQMKPARRERWMRSPRFAAHLDFHRADCLGSHGKLDIYEAARAMHAALPPEPPPPLCTGADVLALGVPEGPVVGAVLRELSTVLEAAEVSDRDTALAHLRRLVEERFRGRP